MNMPATAIRIANGAFLLALITLFASCSFYDAPFRTQQAVNPSGQITPDYTLRYIEADDRGWFWDPSQANDTLSLVKSTATQGDTLVLLFIHGWHHSAACYDANLESFKRVLTNLREELGNQMYQTARLAADGTRALKPVRIIGIYVGWRGRSLPGVIDYTTFWGRKSAAQRVGQGDLAEFVARLQRIYDDHSDGTATSGQKPPFFGLVSIGHSFGGAVLLTSTARYFESEMQMGTTQTGFLHQMPPMPQMQNTPTATGAPLRGFGDLVVLVNPAIEAAAYERINLLSRGMNYSATQSPLLVTFSSTNDSARKGLFTAGRIAGEFFTSAARVDDARERTAERESLGIYDFDDTGITHTLMPAEPHTLVTTQLTAPVDPLCGNETPATFDWWTWKDADDDNLKSAGAKGAFEHDSLNVAQQFTPALARTVLTYDFSQNLRFADLKLERATMTGAPTLRPFRPYQPFMVVSVDPTVIDGHNGIFSEPFMDFLLRYIGFVEAKRFLLTQQRTP